MPPAKLKLQIRSMIERTEDEFQCTVCGITKSNLLAMENCVEIRHIKFRYRCNICKTEFIYRTINGLKAHNNRNHKQVGSDELNVSTAQKLQCTLLALHSVKTCVNTKILANNLFKTLLLIAYIYISLRALTLATNVAGWQLPIIP